MDGSYLDEKSMEAVYALWDELGEFPAGHTVEALAHLFGWLAKQIRLDNIAWIGAVRLLRGTAAKEDPFSGWRFRTRQFMKPERPASRELTAAYYAAEHYGKSALSRVQSQSRDRSRALLDRDTAGQAMMAQAGRFRIYRLRDGWIDHAAFEKTEHYDACYRRQGISDRIHVGVPLNADAESIFMIDRRPSGRLRKAFSDREKALVEMALRGIWEFHRRLFLERGLLMGITPLTPLQQRIVRGLLTGKTEKALALEIGQQPRTLHKYVTLLYTRFGVKGRAGLMAMWLGH